MLGALIVPFFITPFLTCYIKLIQEVVFNLSKKSTILPEHVAWNDRQALSQRIVAIRVVYHTIEEEIHWFGQLTLCMPGVLQQLDTMTMESTEMVSK